MNEPVRLVIWDLDETYWRGTLTEGGIKEYVQAHHDIVIELAKRGIMSSICSKNDMGSVMPILQAREIADYFIFPSISWEPKGIRVAQIIETVQLRPATVLFIDDNPNNLAEARAITPGLQTEDETFLAQILDDPRFKGKDDRGLTRLQQYKLLETKNHDWTKAGSNNEEFLRSCDVRVQIDYDIEVNIDRAIELINRTNQLNYTKRRLPDDIEEARRILRAEMSHFNRQAGLIRVADKYGDYGYIGFFLAQNDLSSEKDGLNLRLLDFCFSCRTLGMLVEKWVYDHLGKPVLTVSGDVLTDLAVDRKIDWVRLVDTLEDDGRLVQAVAPEIRLLGGCEANSVSVYLSAATDKIRVNSNFAAGSLFLRVNSVSFLVSAAERCHEEFGQEARAMDLPFNLMAFNYFADAPQGTIFVLNNSLDAPRWYPRYYHKKHGWEVICEPHGTWSIDLTIDTDQEILSKKSDAVRSEQVPHLLKVASHMRKNYRRGFRSDNATVMQQMNELIEKVPAGSKLIFLQDDIRTRAGDGKIQTLDYLSEFNEMVRNLASDFSYVGIVSFADAIHDESEIQIGGNHYDRLVYFRAAQDVLKIAAKLTPKEG